MYALRGGIDRILRATVRRDVHVDRFARGVVENRHFQSRRCARVRHPNAGATRRGADADAVACRQAVAAGQEANRKVDHFIELVCLDQPIKLEHSAIGGLGAGERCGVRSNRTRAWLRLTDLADDDRLAGAKRLFGHAPEFLRRLHILEEQQENISLTFVEHVVDEVEDLERRLITGCDDVTECKIARSRTVEKRKAQAAALGNDRHLAFAERARWFDRTSILVHCRAEGRAEGSRDIGEAFGIWAAHGHVIAARNRSDFVLHARAYLALLSKTGRKDDGRFDADAPAALKLSWCVLRRDDENREVNRFGQLLNRGIGLEALNLCRTTTDGVDLASEGMAQDDFENAPSQSVNVGTGADDGN